MLNQIREITPRPRGAAEIVEFSGRWVPGGGIQLGRNSRQRVRTALLQAIREEMVTANGLLREIDLDGRSFIVRHPDEGGKERTAKFHLMR